MRTKCIGVTTKGTSCARCAADDSAFCATHQAQSVPTPTPTTIHMEPLTIPEAVDSVMARFDCTPAQALDRLVEHGAITADQRAAWDAEQIVETVNSVVSNGTQAALDAPIINPPTIESEESTPMPTSDTPAFDYRTATTPITVAVPRKDSHVRPYKVKRSDHDRDVQFFDNVLKRRKDIARYVMPEYFECPSTWVPTLKLKQGESLSQRLERDYNAWLKAYAMALAKRKVVKIDGVFFFPAKITPGGLMALVREGNRAYVLAYCAKAMDILGDDPRRQLANLINLELDYPLISAMLADARLYHKANGRKDRIEADVNAAKARFDTSFDAACKALRAINTGDSDDGADSTAAAAGVASVTA